MPSETRVFTAHVPLELAEKVDALASRLRLSRSRIINQALEDWVGAEEERHRMTLQALADVHAGRVISHSAMLLWAKGQCADSP